MFAYVGNKLVTKYPLYGLSLQCCIIAVFATTNSEECQYSLSISGTYNCYLMFKGRPSAPLLDTDDISEVINVYYWFICL